MNDIRWKQRFENYTKALARLQEALRAVEQEPGNHLYEMATIQAFEFTIELGWKLLKDYLQYAGVKEVAVPREVIRQAFQAELITDGQMWMEMLEARNKISDLYDDDTATKVVSRICTDFYPAFQQVETLFLGKLS